MVVTRQGTDTTSSRAKIGRRHGPSPEVERVLRPFGNPTLITEGLSLRTLISTELPDSPPTYPELLNRSGDPVIDCTVDHGRCSDGSESTGADRRSSSGLTSTKGLQDHDYDLPLDQQCTHIVHANEMLNDLLSEVETNLDHRAFRQITITDQSTLEMATLTDPFYTSRTMPRRINSEGDVVDAVKVSLTDPAVYTSVMCNTKELKRLEDLPGEKPLFCTEIQKGKVIADMVLYDSEKPTATPKLRVEVKVDRVIEAFPGKNDSSQHIFLPNLRSSGKPIEFAWPTKANPVPDEDHGKRRNAPNGHSTLTKVIVQVWQQLLKTAKDIGDPDGGMGILTTYASTFFFVRRKNTLFISNCYTVKHPVLLAYIAVISKALGFCKKDFVLPSVNTSRPLTARRRNSRPGLDMHVYETFWKKMKLEVVDEIDEDDDEEDEDEIGDSLEGDEVR